MKILVIADIESKYYWDYYEKGKLDDIDLIISCGDLNPHYLQFLVTLSHCPVIYVHGNHDDKYEQIPPDGCVSIEDDIYVYKGVRILGLGGSMRYKMGAHQYDQKEMKARVRKLWFKLFRHKGFDILVTHSPAFGYRDGEDLPHRGFEAFNQLLEKYSPKYFLHGHVHKTYGRKYKRLGVYNDTLVINGYETYLFEYETEYENNIEEQKRLAIKEAEEEEEKRRKIKSKAVEPTGKDNEQEDIKLCHGKIMSEE